VGLEGFFNAEILISAFSFMHTFQILAVYITQSLGIILFSSGWIALAVEGNERSTSRFFKRGYGWGGAMIVSGLCLSVVVDFIKMFMITFTGDSAKSDPLMMLRMGGDDIANFEMLKLMQFVLAGWMSLTAYSFFVMGFFMFIKASHRQEGGGSAAAKFWLSSFILFWGQHTLRGYEIFPT
jgi:hypothetical protein